MRLHHQPRSRSTRVLWLLEELGIPFDLTVMAREDKQTPEYRALHPLGRSPALETDEDGPLFESAALILHIADRHLDAGLIGPLGSYARGLQYQWCFFGMTEAESALMDIARQKWSDGEPDAGIVERATARYLAAAGVIEAALGGDDYLVDNTFSVADIVVGSVLGFARTGELTELPAGVVGDVDRLQGRPARPRAVAAKLPLTPEDGRPVRLRPAAIRLMGLSHRSLYRLSGGRLLDRVAGMPVLLLTTTGRRSGRARTTPLTYFEVGDERAIVGSNGGEDSPPRWLLNLEADPHATITIGRQSLAVTARLASKEERARLWPLIIATPPGYADYERRTARPIPVVLLAPAGTKENAPNR